jgi:hypothetical protein
MTQSPELPLTAELLLLILDDDEGKPMVDTTKRKAGVAGAAVLQLVLDGALDLGPGDAKRARLVAVPGAAEPRSPVLVEARDRAVAQKPKDAVARIGGASDWKGRADDLQEAVLAELAEAGVLERVERTHVGLFTSKRWVLLRPEVEAEITRRIAAVLDGGQPDSRTAALLALANAVGVLPKVFPDRDKKAMRQRAKEIEQLSWGGEAVSRAIADVQAAVVVAVTVPAVVAGGSA